MMAQNIDTNQKIAVVMGGPGSEHEISMKSGTAVADALESLGYDIQRKVIQEAAIAFETPPDKVFIALHGIYGEDGGIQADLDRLGIPYTGSGAAASALAMNKSLTKDRIRAVGIPTPDYQTLRRGELCDLAGPWVLKPVSEGSSFGLRFVEESMGVQQALEELWIQYDEVLVEEWIHGRELTVGVLGKEALPIVEILAPGGRYDFLAKYTKGLTRFEVPAALPDELTRNMQEMAVRVFEVLGCRGFGRVDILLDPKRGPYVLEINTIPGLTATSLLPKAAAAAGIPFPELVQRMLSPDGP